MSLNAIYMSALESIKEIYNVRTPQDTNPCKCGCGRKTIKSEFYSLSCAVRYKESHAE